MGVNGRRSVSEEQSGSSVEGLAVPFLVPTPFFPFFPFNVSESVVWHRHQQVATSDIRGQLRGRGTTELGRWWVGGVTAEIITRQAIRQRNTVLNTVKCGKRQALVSNSGSYIRTTSLHKMSDLHQGGQDPSFHQSNHCSTQLKRTEPHFSSAVLSNMIATGHV